MDQDIRSLQIELSAEKRYSLRLEERIIELENKIEDLIKKMNSSTKE